MAHMNELKTICVEEWAKITLEPCMPLVPPYRRCLETVLTTLCNTFVQSIKYISANVFNTFIPVIVISYFFHIT